MLYIKKKIIENHETCLKKTKLCLINNKQWYNIRRQQVSLFLILCNI